MRKIAIVFLTALLLMPNAARAVSSNWQHDSEVDVRLISSLQGVGQKKIIPLGLEVKMEPGWHTYWRSPGAAGLPPQFDWSKSQTDAGNLAQATVYYPAPRRYTDQNLETIGYKNHVIFPIDAEVRHVGQSLAIDTTVTLLVCSTECVPKTFTIKLNVPHDSAIEDSEADVLNPARALVPGQDEDKAGLSLKNITNDGTTLSFEIASRDTMTDPDIFIESDPEIPFGAPKIKLLPDHHSAILIVKPEDKKQDLATLAHTPLLITIVDETHALESPAEIPPLAGTESEQPRTPLSLRMALLLAIAGGFILNLMPCVLPVLSLKILSIVGHGGSHPAVVRRSFLATACGIMFSFLLLAGMTLAVKSLGLTLGWGMQFQQPLFVIALIIVLSIFAANMWGLFEIGLPRFAADKLSLHHPKMAGDFATGALATLLATPCTAPFLGTAIGFALAADSSRDILAIFVALGFGMTLPYLTVAFIPELAALLPKPGRWMRSLRFLLGIALASTAVWLLWVLSVQLMHDYIIGIGCCLLGIIALLSLRARGFVKSMIRIGVWLLIALTVALALLGGAVKQAPSVKAENIWQPFDEASIATQVAAGHTVFVDITASWCLTCKANKKFVLSDDDITNRLFHSDVVAMQGDWTSPDPKITGYLHKFRRYGIPFDVVYGPGVPQGITLPELLTHDTVMEALNKAAKR